MEKQRPKTIICDIDGTLIKHCGDICQQHLIDDKEIVLPGTLDKIREWDRSGYRIVLLTGRKESTRKATEHQLEYFGIIYDQLIMGVTGGERILINDMKPGKTDATAICFNLERNKGLGDIDV